jgi:S-adenosylmethionine-diacylglycerol 3-amino-3-carboxypropyl transferase
MTSFATKVNYSSSNEDSGSELKALALGPRDRVLCITGSGARSLDLLTAGPASIVSIDFNPCQTHLLELKMKAMAALDYEGYVAFLGLVPSGGREDAYRRIRPGLTAEARAFWDARAGMIRRGVLYEGGWEKYFRGLALAVGLARNGLREALFASPTLDRQARLWDEAWDGPAWRLFLGSVSGRTVWRTTFGDPGFYAYVPPEFPVVRYIAEKFRAAARNVLLRRSHYAELLFFGHYRAALPPYLRRECFDVIRDRLGRIQPETAPLGDYLEGWASGAFDAFSLSDFASYTDRREYDRIWKGVLRASAPGARVCERQYLVKRTLPAFARGAVVRDSALEADLEARDASLFFSFVAAKVKENGHARN